MKMLTSLNWVAGSLLVLLAAAWPLIDNVLSNGQHTVVQATVDTLVTAQQTHHSIREDYILFDASERDMSSGFQKLDLVLPEDNKYVYESYRGEDGAVIVQGRASPAAIVREQVPPLLYRVRIAADGHADDGVWEQE